MLSKFIITILLFSLMNINCLILTRKGFSIPRNKYQKNLNNEKYTMLSIHKINRNNNISSKQMKLEVVPQIIFAASCALSVFFYVWNNIDEIKLKQKIATGIYY